MPVINFSQADVLRTKVMTAGWYSFAIAKVDGPKANAKNDGVNYEVIFRLIDTGTELDGKEISRTFSNKAMSMMIPLAAAAEGKKLADVTEAFQLDTDALVGAKIDGAVIVGEYQGNPKNEVNEYAPYKTVVGKSGGF